MAVCFFTDLETASRYWRGGWRAVWRATGCTRRSPCWLRCVGNQRGGGTSWCRCTNCLVCKNDLRYTTSHFNNDCCLRDVFARVPIWLHLDPGYIESGRNFLFDRYVRTHRELTRKYAIASIAGSCWHTIASAFDVDNKDLTLTYPRAGYLTNFN